MEASRPGTSSATTLHAWPCFLKLSKNVLHSSSPQRGPRADAAACAEARSRRFCDGRRGGGDGERGLGAVSAETTTRSATRRAIRPPRRLRDGSLARRLPNSPDLAGRGNAPLRRRLSRASPAARRSRRHRRIGRAYSRFARARDARNLPWSLTSEPPFHRDRSDLLLPSRDENFRARPGAREPTARLPRDHSADETPTSSASALHLDAGSDTPGVARPRTCESRARCGPLALPETKTQRVRVRRDGPLSRELFREIRARTPRSRDLPRRLPRLSPLGIVGDDPSFDERRAARARVRRESRRGDASCLVVPKVASWAVAPPAEGSLLQNS